MATPNNHRPGGSPDAADRASPRPASQEDVNNLLDGAPDAMIIASGQGVIERVNTQAESMFGYTREELIGQSINRLIPGHLHRQHDGHLARFAARPAMRPMGIGLELRALRKGGAEFPVEISLSPLRGDGPLRIFASIRDASERRQAERRLREQNEALERAHRVKDAFLASVSHELRTPLNAILGFAGTLLMKLPGPLNAEQEDQLRTLERNARHLAMLVEDVLEAAKVDSGALKPEPEAVDLNALLGDLAATYGEDIAAKGLTLNLRRPEQALVVRSDRKMIWLIVSHLIQNAVKFTARGGIELALERKEGPARPELLISVTDTGAGMRPEQVQTLFQPFAKHELPDGRFREGVGLGLYLARRFAQLLEARLTCESEPGKGSRFVLALREE